jgi:hypothetical protein
MHNILFHPEDGHSRLLQNIGSILPDYTASHLHIRKRFDAKQIDILFVDTCVITLQTATSSPIAGTCSTVFSMFLSFYDAVSN